MRATFGELVGLCGSTILGVYEAGSVGKALGWFEEAVDGATDGVSLG